MAGLHAWSVYKGPRNKEGFEEKTHSPVVLFQLHGMLPRYFWKELNFGGLGLTLTPYPRREPWYLLQKAGDPMHGCPLVLWAQGLELSLGLARRSWHSPSLE